MRSRGTRASAWVRSRRGLLRPVRGAGGHRTLRSTLPPLPVSERSCPPYPTSCRAVRRSARQRLPEAARLLRCAATPHQIRQGRRTGGSGRRRRSQRPATAARGRARHRRQPRAVLRRNRGAKACDRFGRAVDGDDRPAARQQRERLGAVSTAQVDRDQCLIVFRPARQEPDRVHEQSAERASLDSSVVLVPADL